VPSVIGHLAADLLAAVVLAAFGAVLRYLAGRALGGRPRPPRLRAPGRRRGLIRAGWRAAVAVLTVAGRFASGAPLGRRRTDATFVSAGTRVTGGVPAWFSRGQPGRWAFLPGWQRAGVRWAAVAVAAGLWARPVQAGTVIAALAVLSAAVGWPWLGGDGGSGGRSGRCTCSWSVSDSLCAGTFRCPFPDVYPVSFLRAI
jgi:hypothetical protein